MTTETMTTEATKTTEGVAASEQANETATGAVDTGQQQQANEGQQSEGVKTEDASEKPEGAPESYEFTAPEGISFDEGVIGTFSEVAKELNLPQNAAQKVLDKMAPVIQSRQMAQIEAVKSQWTEATKTDKVIGGEHLAENLAVAKKALDTFGTPEFNKLLNDSGFGNHPEVIRVFYRAGKAISEDRFVAGTGGKNTPQSVAQRMYPSMNP